MHTRSVPAFLAAILAVLALLCTAGVSRASLAATYAGHIIPAGDTGILDVTFAGDEQFKGKYSPAGDAGSPAPDLSAEWDLVYGAGYYARQVKGNRFYARAVLVSGSGATLVTEIAGDDSSKSKATGVARDSRGNVYKVSFGD